MPPHQSQRWVLLPIAGVFAYAIAIALLPQDWAEAFLSEQGPIELGTAALYFAAAVVALKLCRTQRETLPQYCRLLFALFAVGATFVALEEVSYGQHLFFWESPAWFQQHNKQGEMNLHNLAGNAPSSVLRTIASLGYPLAFAILPLIYLQRRQAFRPGHWTYYLLPQAELIALIVLAQLITLPHKLPRQGEGYEWTFRLGEFKELYWAIATYAYIRLISARTASSSPRLEIVVEPLPAPERRMAA